MNTWDFSKVPEADQEQLSKHLEEGWEPFAVVPLPVRVNDGLSINPQIMMASFIYFKKISNTKENVVESLPEPSLIKP